MRSLTLSASLFLVGLATPVGAQPPAPPASFPQAIAQAEKLVYAEKLAPDDLRTLGNVVNFVIGQLEPGTPQPPSVPAPKAGTPDVPPVPTTQPNGPCCGEGHEVRYEERCRLVARRNCFGRCTYHTESCLVPVCVPRKSYGEMSILLRHALELQRELAGLNSNQPLDPRRLRDFMIQGYALAVTADDFFRPGDIRRDPRKD